MRSMQQQSGSKRLKNSRYISGFDGIRTIAVIGVIVYHLLPYSLTGGYLGVPIFFVVSGYLITDLLLQEYEQNGMIDIWAFYGRRIHTRELQMKMLKALGFTKERAENQFGYLLNALDYGFPPHGGLAIGLDRSSKP